LDKVPFSVYDFFAYLSSGSILLAAFDYIFGIALLTQDKIAPLFAVLLVVLAYVCGHIIAHFSSFLYEHVAVSRVLKRPNDLLMGGTPKWRLQRLMFPNYCRALPAEVQLRIGTKTLARGFSGKDEGLFLHCYAVVTADETRQNRLDAFRNQYGFARNMSFAFLVAAVGIVAARYFGVHPVKLWWALLSGLASITLFYRYLKFFRQFSYEMFLRYAELEPVKTS
jgi:hypothetical protein